MQVLPGDGGDAFIVDRPESHHRPRRLRLVSFRRWMAGERVLCDVGLARHLHRYTPPPLFRVPVHLDVQVMHMSVMRTKKKKKSMPVHLDVQVIHLSVTIECVPLR